MTGPYNTEALRWRALTIRDPNANGHFVYAVKTTFCYCRPTCPARLARRANVAFYNTCAQAEAAGFHACKRCKPSEPIQEQPAERAVAKACALIEEALKADGGKSVKLQDLAKTVGLTPRYFHKVFKDKMGVTPKEWAKTKREKGAQVGSSVSVVSQGGSVSTAIVGSSLLDGRDALRDINFDDLVDFDPDFVLTLDNTLPETTLTPLTEDLPTPDFASVLPEAEGVSNTGVKGTLGLSTQNSLIRTNKGTTSASKPEEVTQLDFALDLTQILDSTMPIDPISLGLENGVDIASWDISYQDFVWGDE